MVFNKGAALLDAIVLADVSCAVCRKTIVCRYTIGNAAAETADIIS